MGNLVLLISLTILVFMSVYGYRKGLIRMAFSLLSTVLVLVLVSALTPMVSSFIAGTSVYDYIENNMQEYIEEYIEDNVGSTVSMGVSVQTEVIENMPIPETIKNTLIDNNTDSGYYEMEVDNFTSYLSRSLSKMLINAIVYIVLFIVIIIALRIAIHLLDLIAKLPVLNLLNKTMGTIFGLAEGVVILWIGCIVLTAFAHAAWAQSAFEEINNSAFLTLIYNTNIFSNAVTGIF